LVVPVVCETEYPVDKTKIFNKNSKMKHKIVQKMRDHPKLLFSPLRNLYIELVDEKIYQTKQQQESTGMNNN